MSRRNLASALSVVLTALLMPSIHAQDQRIPERSGAMMIPTQASDPSERFWAQGAPQPAAYYRTQNPGDVMPPMAIDPNPAPVGLPEAAPGYVRLGAPMYPSPKPNIPIWAGSTMITNQALAPQEMLYPHTYRGIYPPYYHRVKGGWVLTPLGVRSHERWQLQGTMVQVKYRSNYPGVFSGACWHPPATSYMHGAWR